MKTNNEVCTGCRHNSDKGCTKPDTTITECEQERQDAELLREKIIVNFGGDE